MCCSVQGPDCERGHHPVLPRHGRKTQGQGPRHPGDLSYSIFLRVLLTSSKQPLLSITFSTFSRSFGARLCLLASADVPWSPRCTTARLSSLSRAGTDNSDRSDIYVDYVQGPEAGWPHDQGQQPRNILPVISQVIIAVEVLFAHQYPTSGHSPYVINEQ